MSTAPAAKAGEIPGVIAHRGLAARYPENTLPALEAALALGVDGVEFDVQFTRDAQPVLLHDVTLRRTCGHPARISELTREQASSLSAGEAARLGDRFGHVRVPALEDAAALLGRWPGAVAFVEIKREPVDALGASRVAARVLAGLDGVLDQCVVISYDATVLGAARAQGAPRIGQVLDVCDEADRGTAESLGPEFIFCETGGLPAVPWPGPWRWAVFEVTDPEQALALGRRGVALVESMAPDRLLAHPAFRSRARQAR